MKVVICGAGQVGFGIAERLAAEQNDVSIIDTSPRLIQAVTDTLDVRGFVGHGSHPDVLARAGLEAADMMIAVTLHDEVNMIACQVGHALFDVPTKIARVRAQSYLQGHWRDMFSRDHLPIDVVISPELEVGEMVLRRLSLPGAVDTVSFADGNVVVVGVRCQEDCPLLDTPLRQLTDLFPDLRAVVVAVNRNGKTFVPRSTDALIAGDLAYFTAQSDQVDRTLTLFGHDERPAQRIVIGGGGNIGLYVARELEQRNPKARVKIIEDNLARAEAVAQELSRTVVLRGSALDRTILEEAAVGDADTVIAVTNDDRVNILSCLMSRELGAKRMLSLLNDPAYPTFARGLGIDAYVNPRQITGLQDPAICPQGPHPRRPLAAERRRRGDRGGGAGDLAAGRHTAEAARPVRRHAHRRGDPGGEGAAAARRHRHPGARPGGDVRPRRQGEAGGAALPRESRVLLRGGTA